MLDIFSFVYRELYLYLFHSHLIQVLYIHIGSIVIDKHIPKKINYKVLMQYYVSHQFLFL